MTDLLSKDELEDPVQILHEWNDITGFIPKGNSYMCEIEGVVQDAYDLGKKHEKQRAERLAGVVRLADKYLHNKLELVELDDVVKSAMVLDKAIQNLKGGDLDG